jgi:predicted 3-demethylubiquinone-9 3-methyltransferase (glyoxalase superfamily)
MSSPSHKITPCLWFEDRAEEAVTFYRSVFKNSSSDGMKFNGMVALFEIEGQPIMILQGGPHYKLSEAFSLSVNCKDQAETDYYWDKLGEGGSYSQCGWLKDKFGVSWQIVPEAFPRLLNDPDQARAGRAMQAMMKMQKLDVAELEAAFNG